MLPRLLLLICAPLCEPAELLLIVSPSHPTEGSPVTLTCKMPSLQSSDAQFQFCFFRDAQALGPGWSSSPKLQIANMWKEDSGSYWCEAQTMASKVLRSWRSQINVHRVPVADVSLETQPPGGQVMEGDRLVLICSVAMGTGDITFLWYKGAMGLNLQTKTQRSLTAEYEIPTARESDAEQYYCVAENGYGPRPSGLVSITVRIPVSRPMLMLRAPRAQAVVGDVLTLHCEALRGSHPILYWFYHEDVILGSSSAPSGGGASFNLSLTTEHSGNYSCEANNGLGAQRSEEVTLNFTVPPGARSNHLTSGVIEGLLGTLGPATVALLFCYGLKRKIGRRSTMDPLRSLPSPVPQEFPYLNSPTPGQLQPIYENVNVVSGHEIYSLVYYNQPEQESAAAETLGTHMEDQVSLDIYSRLRKANITDVDYEDAM
ncbi:PREDICTED: Fc receptor-like protein 1 isoform X1 [Colobus angolensis palliatus]|uniref:Ig-like domain-containing protein n=1 Tax=Colobus angolensis palliatus TaxID=336983 RepID=A0A2K5KF26_COLAP|nr:PREDICTED: Fc receptor-like protein 1 isoform X1 [Colobus angolensis palliatus]